MLTKKFYNKANKFLISALLVTGLGIYGKVGLQYASVPFSNKVSEENVQTYIDNLAKEANFKEPIKVNIADNWSDYGPACAKHEKGVNNIYVSRPFLRETVLRHEAKHILDEHVKQDRRNIFRNEYNEWVATLYGLGLTH